MPGHAGLSRAATVVGRDGELAAIQRAVGSAVEHGRSCLVVLGEGGIGKTRLLTEAAARAEAQGLAVLSGRPPVALPTPFSLIAAILRSHLRHHPPPSDVSPFDRGLALVVPEWTSPGSATDLDVAQQRLLAFEGVVQLIRSVIEQTGGAVVIADDLHAADPESIEAIRYLATAELPGLALLIGMRTAESPDADAVIRQLRSSGLADAIELAPLGERAVGELVESLLDASPPSPLIADVLARTDGVPILVEEVVRGHVDAGTVAVDGTTASWSGGAARVPGTLRELVNARLSLLDDADRSIVVAGAVVVDFEPSLMRALTDADDAQIAAALDAGCRAGLLETNGGVMAFRHAIIRDAVVEDTVPHLVDTLHRRAADALADDARPDALERRATHLFAVGDNDEAAGALAASANQLRRDHALLAAERNARLALDRAEQTRTRATAADVLAQTLADQGRWAEALELDDATVAEHGDTPVRLLRHTTCALDAGLPDLADSLLASAAADDRTPALALVIGRAALVRGDGSQALIRAQGVLATTPLDLDTRLNALDLQGRAHDFLGDRDTARASWTQQATEAERAGATQGRLRAVIQLGKSELFAGEPPHRLFEAVELAEAAGSLVELAWAEENLGISLALNGDLPAAVAVFDRAIDRCRLLQLDQVAYLMLSRAMTRSYVVTDDVFAEFDEAEARAPSPDLLLHTASMRADVAMRRGDWDLALHWLNRGIELGRAMPGVVPLDCICWLPWVLTIVGRRDEAATALDEARGLPDLARFESRPVIVAGAAALLDDDPEAIDVLVKDLTELMPLDATTMMVLAARVFGGEYAPRWRRQALDIYEAAGAAAEADRVRRALRESGAAVPRKRRVRMATDPRLADAGVTEREAEVLDLIGLGLPNADIAERLFVSIRTVESHVSAMLRKLGARNRSELVAKARQSGEPPDSPAS